MNKSRSQLPVRIRKKMDKNVRSGILHPEPLFVADDTKKTTLLSSRGDKLKKEIQEKQKKSLKRAVPSSEFSGKQATPQGLHVEGKRWIKTLKKQTAAKNKVLVRKETKIKR